MKGVSRVEGSVRTQGGISTNAKGKRKGKDKRIMGIKQVHDTCTCNWILRYQMKVFIISLNCRIEGHISISKV